MEISARQLFEDDAKLAATIASMVAGSVVSSEHTGAFLANRSNVLIAGMIDDAPVGFISAHLLDRFKDRRRKLFIYEVDVMPAFRRLGVGRTMIEKVLEAGRSQGADTAFVLTNRSNPAGAGLYAAVGGRDVHADDVMFEFTL